MTPTPAAVPVKERLSVAAKSLGVVDPTQFVGGLIDRSFPLPLGDEKVARNALMPGYAPAQPRFRTGDGDVLRFVIEPLGPESSPVTRRHEATREMRRLVGPIFGRDALKYFDKRSEEWRGMSSISRLDYGAWFGTAYDNDGLKSASVAYELHPWQLNGLPPSLARLVATATESLPTLMPLFTSIAVAREAGNHGVTIVHRGPLRLGDLDPLMQRLGLAHQLAGVMQVVGLTLGGRFHLPEGAALIGLAETPEGPELKLEILLGRLPDVPASFLDLLALGLAERPHELRSLVRWLQAFTPENGESAGQISVLSIRTTPRTPPKVSLFLRPIEFEVGRRHEREEEEEHERELATA
jgi:hypothetical protein